MFATPARGIFLDLPRKTMLCCLFHEGYLLFLGGLQWVFILASDQLKWAMAQAQCLYILNTNSYVYQM